MSKNAFSLAEVLITLVIIGVIAAITIPSLMNNTNENEFRTAIKKAFSGLNQALTLHYSLESLSASDYSTAEEITSNIFKKRMIILEDDERNSFTTQDCQGASAETIFTTMDGMIFCIDSSYTSAMSDRKGSICDFHNTTPCSNGLTPNIWIDVNGERKPNKLTISYNHPRDIYQGMIYSQRVLPFGEATTGVVGNISPNTSGNDDNENPQPDPTPGSTPAIEPTPNPDPNPDIDEPGPDENPEDNPYYDQWDPKRWPNFWDFLRWILGQIFGGIFG